MGKTELTVAVVSYGRPQELARCLDAVMSQSVVADQVLVGLRTSDAESRSMLASHPGRGLFKVINVERPGQVAALNAVRSATTTGLVAFLDDDAIPSNRWIEHIRAHFDADPLLGGLGGPDIVHRNGVPVVGTTESVGRVTRFGRLIGHHHLKPSTALAVAFLKGANMAFRTEALLPFDERLRGSGAQVCNDLEASLSVHRRGWRVLFSPLVTVDHHPAVRLDDDQRGARSLAAECAEQHNELYVLLRHSRPRARIVVTVRRIAVGSQRAPGIGLGVVRLFSPAINGRRRSHASRVASLTKARLAAVATYRRARRR